ncbi:MAG: helix-turn-helix domain-containing protein [Lachnospiraceae bacterium]|nr:helix-turn-helix domain-containing protein [Lachnospiraceae bacterium]
MTIAERIFDLAKAQRKRQSDIARALNVRATTVSEWRKGKHEVSAAYYPKLAEFFGVSLDYLITGKEPRGAPSAPVQQIIGNNNTHNTAIAGGLDSDITALDLELLKVVAGFDIRAKTEVLHFAYQIEKQIKSGGGF